jgi:hypothetical protein
MTSISAEVPKGSPTVFCPPGGKRVKSDGLEVSGQHVRLCLRRTASRNGIALGAAFSGDVWDQ